MQVSNEILLAAKELGEALKASPSVQAYLEACADVEQDAELSAMEADLQSTYEALVARQRQGQVIPPQEINAFYKLRETVVYNPLIEAREAALKAVKAEFEQVGGTISSILSVDYTALAAG